ncbi:hypothetical protein DPMN_133294 [Dreissena polymorpha]|uniref:Uncharacterized protein n=1 Tax=Dreissena polymorpha TaxID=45954 RepID=A0A9D4FUY5_DREPO|nr:hypothetical protein DPMN_133294 [Dreissena polymorpha]
MMLHRDHRAINCICQALLVMARTSQLQLTDCFVSQRGCVVCPYVPASEMAL